MQTSFAEQFPDSFVAVSLAQGFDALFNRWKPNLLVRRDCFCTGAIHGVVGQHQMGQADQMQVIDDRSFMQHLVFAKPRLCSKSLNITSILQRRS